MARWLLYEAIRVSTQASRPPAGVRLNAPETKPKRQRKPQQKAEPIFGVVRKLMDVATGEMVLGIVALGNGDREEMKRRGYHVGDELRMELKKARNPKFHRLVLGMVNLVMANSDLITVRQTLSVLKIKTGYAEPIVDSATNKTYWNLMSISYDNMDDGEFKKFWNDMCKVVGRDYFPNWTQAQVSAAAERMSNDF